MTTNTDHITFACRLKDAFEAAGWSSHGHTFKASGGRVVVQLQHDDGDQWAAVVAGCPAKHGPDPLTALRRGYAATDTRRVAAALRPVLVALREPEAERKATAIAIFEDLPTSSTWWDMIFRRAQSIEPLYPDVADRYLRALDLAGRPPEEIRDTVTELRARLEDMG